MRINGKFLIDISLVFTVTLWLMWSREAGGGEVTHRISLTCEIVMMFVAGENGLNVIDVSFL